LWRLLATQTNLLLMRILIFGAGYVGLPLARALRNRSHEVIGVTRSAERACDLAAENLSSLIADVTDRSTLIDLPKADVVINLVSSSHGGSDDYRRVYVEGTQNVLDALKPIQPSRFLQASSTGVYAQDDGSIVDESSATEPEAATGKALVEMEKLVLNQPAGVVMRISGIYGPCRGHLYKQFLSGEARITGKPERHLNMVHRDDIVAAFVAALEHSHPRNAYNITDDEPVRQVDFYKWFATQLGRPMPEAASSETDRKRAVTDKRVSNRKARHELKWQLRYPTFREGFAGDIEKLRETA
jgi:nucleoside-diphosphate-sugar epimerase